MIVGAALALVLVAVLALTGVLSADRLATIVAVITILAAIGYFVVILGSKKITKVERSPGAVVHSDVHRQRGVLVALPAAVHRGDGALGQAAQQAHLRLGDGGELGAVHQPVFIIILSGVFAALWTKLGTRQPSTPIKFALGTIVILSIALGTAMAGVLAGYYSDENQVACFRHPRRRRHRGRHRADPHGALHQTADE